MVSKSDNVLAVKSTLSNWFPGAKVNETDQMGQERQLHQFSINGSGVKCIVSVQEDILTDYETNDILKLFSKYDLRSQVDKNPNSHLIVYPQKIKIEPFDRTS